MDNYTMRLQVQATMQQMVESFMQQNNLSAAVVEDALNKTTLYIKDLVVKEMLVARQEQQQIEPDSQEGEEQKEE